MQCKLTIIAPEDTVSMSDFGKLAGWFGPVTPADPSGESLGFLDRVLIITIICIHLLTWVDCRSTTPTMVSWKHWHSRC